ncbi:hypothetical protein A3L11_08240 [Thermococcus siculi]|uniref:Uncharacterized protein n=1 Tax=Thermococcus siculi TaxID=72803 RepID=A0A2Z2MVF7_9EURY|nr:hypothetical protein [Thermococcus siculi]ASJ09776.1 hypothetical protein A3L11_08240 [Thermococcus siculi]
MKYEILLETLRENPLDIGDAWVKDYLRNIFEFHLERTPYWRDLSERVKPDLDEIFQGSLTEVFEKIFNSGLTVDEDYLRAHWLDFVPEGYSGRIRFYQSSGTTRERAIGHWDADYLNVLHAYMRAALDEIYGLSDVYNDTHRMRAIAHGPYGWYQDEISELVWSYGGTLYFIGMETDGLKRVLREKGLDAVLKLLDPLVRYTKRVMETDRINTVRSAPPLMSLFEPYSDSIETAIISGVGINREFFDHLSGVFENTTLIPLYGYYLFGDLVGIRRGGEFWYYPNYPTTLVFPMKPVDGEYRITKRGERGKVAFIIARPEVLMVKFEDETAVRVPPSGPFKWDGFGAPMRDVG